MHFHHGVAVFLRQGGQIKLRVQLHGGAHCLRILPGNGIGLIIVDRRLAAGEGGVQRDLLLMQVEDMQLAAKDLLRDCKDFLGGEMEERKRNLPAFCDMLSVHVAKLETVAG